MLDAEHTTDRADKEATVYRERMYDKTRGCEGTRFGNGPVFVVCPQGHRKNASRRHYEPTFGRDPAIRAVLYRSLMQ